jgi:hypothetical protein
VTLNERNSSLQAPRLLLVEDTQQANPETGDKPITILLIIISGFGFS